MIADALRERSAIIAESHPGMPERRVKSWAYADVARQTIDRARGLPGQWPADPRLRAASDAVRRCLSPRRDAMVGPQDVAVEALEALARVLDVVEAEIEEVRKRVAADEERYIRQRMKQLHGREGGR